ncbi:glycosyltransferase family 2 protein [Pelotalea chapellei]|uniref:Glycosyltransferase n=1 Tax=Pelotalea chapellei TaxID=44671 RepID=A0ABS5UA84_9BACT|nr:glycosyltransferase family 2 protein [Pelotalea chapellei]MBT1072550.1 glycosyltransferase [Pelotalea chapellei]
MPTFSIVIPVKPGGAITALESLRRLSSSCRFEILVAEGCRPSQQRNLAVQEAAGEIVFFLDDDSRVAADCLGIIATVMTDPAVGVVGGPSLTPAGDSLLQRLFGGALVSCFGAGGMRNRYRSVGRIRETTEKELILCNLAMRREVFTALNGFDERLYPNEENELLDRVGALGLKLMHVPEMAVERSQRTSIRQFVRQMFSYGRGRGQQTLISRSVSPLSFAPLGLLIYLMSLPFGVVFSPFWLIPLIAYLVLDILFSISAVFSSRELSKMLLLFIFPLLHISNGCGLLYGLCRGRGGGAEVAAMPVVVRRIKTFEQDVW